VAPSPKDAQCQTPRLHNTLAWHKLDLPALHATSEKRGGITFAICISAGCPVAALNRLPLVSSLNTC
jgi:hypothetical protein